ncbi:MAG TPA: hypothetical protein VLM89_02120 [Phycisphaerae bacterium]|nr:hypothetical protein [Phycisphaerae bacterium]
MFNLSGNLMLGFLDLFAWWQWLGLVLLIVLIIVYFQMRKRQS